MSAQLRMRVESAHGRECMACGRMTDRWMLFAPTREAEPERYCHPCFEDALSSVRRRGGVPHGDMLRHVYATVKSLDEKVVQLMEDLARAQKELQTARREADEARAKFDDVRSERDRTHEKLDDALNSLSDAIRQRDEARREADRFRHGCTVEGDFVCPNEYAVSELTAERNFLRALKKKHEEDFARVCKERDEARAEVEHAYREGGALYEAKIAEREAFRCGAEAMREACIGTACAQDLDPDAQDRMEEQLRALPIPEEP